MGAAGSKGLRGEVASVCVLPSPVRSPKSEVDNGSRGEVKKTGNNLTRVTKGKSGIFTHVHLRTNRFSWEEMAE